VAYGEGLRAQRAGREALRRRGEVPLRDWFYEVQWRAGERAVGGAVTAAAAAAAAVAGGRWVVLADAGGVGAALAESLRAAGEGVRLAGPEVAAAGGGELERLLAEELAAVDGAASLRGVVHLWSLPAPGAAETTSESLAASLRVSCGSLLRVVQALAQQAGDRPPRLWVVTRGAQPAVAGGPLAVAQSPVWGLGRTVRLEHAEVWGGLIDLDPAGSAAEARQLAAELLAPDGEDQVALRQAGRHVPRLVRSGAARTGGRPLALRSEASYLISGGFGGLGLTVARWLVERGARHLALVGRREPPAAARAAVGELERSGARVECLAADVSQPAAVAAALARIGATMPPLRGVVHAAGTLADGVLATQDWERFGRVFGAKVQGAWNLHCQTQELPLDFFVLFSSAAALLGSPGQSNYAAANAFLDALAHHRRALGLAALSIDWGGWSEVGMAASQSSLPLRGIGLIAPAAGLQALALALRPAGGDGQPLAPQIAIVPVDWPRLRQALPQLMSASFASVVAAERPAAAAVPPDVVEGGLLRQLMACPPRQRRDQLLAHLRQRVSKVLRLPASQPLSLRQPLLEMGFDSLMAIELRSGLSRGLARRLPATLVFEHPTLELLADHLCATVLPPPAAPPAAVAGLAARAPEETRWVAEVQQLDDAQVLSLVDAELERLRVPGRSR
jgi:hypothetical protein